ncbi:MAG TPA: hypothetical protein VM621_15530 [Luteibacter sp.]|uniref:hypothetical protein n=1 Tax=Luteibacter sp. TaxID=1886636 RepID=UPI002B73FB4F|nr:hypothetical protein [Luteibacter sp.]HVI56454.1 hypothetical protein [Luteibacter sp.]
MEFRHSKASKASGLKVGGARRQGEIDPSFGSNGTFDVTIGGYPTPVPNEIGAVRALARVHDGNILLALGAKDEHWQYALARLTPDGALDTTFGQEGENGKTGFVVGALPIDLSMNGSQAWPAPDRSTVLVVTSQYGGMWTLVRHTPDGSLDTAFGTYGYVNLDAIRPAGEPSVVRGFVVPGPGHDFFFVGSTKDADGNYAGGIVFRFDASGRLNPGFAGKGYVFVDVPLRPAGRITDAVVQGDGKIVLSTATTSGNGRIVRLLPTGEPDPGFGTNGVFVVAGDSADRNEIEKLAWSKEAGLWGVGTIMTRKPLVGLLVALDDSGTIPASFNGGRLLEIDYGSTGHNDGIGIPLHLQTSADGGVMVVGSPYSDGSTASRKALVGKHLPSGALDPSFGHTDDSGTPQGFYTVDLAREGYNFIFFGVDLTEDHVVFEILNGDGGGGTNPDRLTVESYFAT